MRSAELLNNRVNHVNPISKLTCRPPLRHVELLTTVEDGKILPEPHRQTLSKQKKNAK